MWFVLCTGAVIFAFWQVMVGNFTTAFLFLTLFVIIAGFGLANDDEEDL